MKSVKAVAPGLALVMLFALGAPTATLADGLPISYFLSSPNAGLSGYPGAYGTITIDANSAGTAATITFASRTSGSYMYLLGGNGAADVNVLGSFTASGLTGTLAFPPDSNAGLSFDPNKNADGFGAFSETVDANGGYTDAYTEISFDLTNTSGTPWVDSAHVLTANSNGAFAAMHAFACLVNSMTGACDPSAGALVTGYASNPGGVATTPEPSSLLLAALGLLAMIGAVCWRREKLNEAA